LGKGVAKNFTKALHWNHKAAEQGNEEAAAWILGKARSGNADATDVLAGLYKKGVIQDHSQIIYWQRKSAEKGDEKAMVSIRKAAEKGDADAMDALAYLYEKGIGVSSMTEQPTYWRLKAKEKEKRKGRK